MASESLFFALPLSLCGFAVGVAFSNAIALRICMKPGRFFLSVLF